MKRVNLPQAVKTAPIERKALRGQAFQKKKADKKRDRFRTTRT